MSCCPICENDTHKCQCPKIYSNLTHMCQSVEGALRHRTDEDWATAMNEDDGRAMNPAKAKSIFLNLKDKGVEVVRIADCDNFDDKKGCLGHVVEHGYL